MAETTRVMIDQWNKIYGMEAITDWEKIDLCNCKEFLEESNLNFSKIHKILDVGCGRGYRLFTMLLNMDRLNRNDVCVTAVDIAENAIYAANENLSLLSKGVTPELLKGFIPNDKTLRCKINFESADILKYETNQEYDLVIDWMCFHEIYEFGRKEYIEIVSRLCKRFYMLNTFSKEGNNRSDLKPVIDGIPKHMFSQEEIENMFDRFLYISHKQYEEVTNPIPPHSDGIIAAKRAYLMVKKRI